MDHARRALAVEARRLAINAARAQLRARGLRPRRLHGIEHANVSQFIAAGIGILTVSRRLGHASAAITLRIYSRRFANTDARPAEIMEATFAKVQTEQEHSGGNPVAIAPGKG
jgi:integrase